MIRIWAIALWVCAVSVLMLTNTDRGRENARQVHALELRIKILELSETELRYALAKQEAQ